MNEHHQDPPKSRSGIIQSSTREFIQEGRARGVSLYDLIHGYIYGRWTYLYIGLGLGEHPLYRRVIHPIYRLTRPARRWIRGLRGSGEPRPPRLDPTAPLPSPSPTVTMAGVHNVADTYHGKVLPLESARRLVTVKEDIALPDLEQIIPYPQARALILKNPDHIAVLDCPCRSSRPDPCLPLDVCMVVGEPFAGFVVEHNPKKAHFISQAEAEQILEETDRRGNVHHAFFKDAMLGRFYAICNCCDCCCGALENQRRGHPMLAASGYVCEVDELLCIGCGECVGRCQFHAITLPDGISQIDASACMGCGVCVNGCEQGALSLRRDPTKGEPLEIQELMRMAAV